MQGLGFRVPATLSEHECISPMTASTRNGGI